ncbi:MAG TPA: radical SAM protein [Anaerolineae bacterium]|nr:radical SAM protein [Anaerolineae bacterium]
MRIQLFNPPVHHYSGVHYKMNPPLGLPILAAVLERAGHKAEVWDLEALKIPPARLAQSFEEQKDRWPDAIGLTTTTHNARGARECIATLREVGFDRYVALGGPHVTLDPTVEWGQDVVVTGECEGNIVSVFEKRMRGVVKGERAPLGSIPGPLWAKHKPHPTAYYGNAPRLNFPEGIAMWSRGCPHRCIFCGNPVFQQQAIRFRPPERIYEDMAAVKALGAHSVFVYDDELVGAGKRQNPWLIETCARVAPLGLTWKCQGRCSHRLSEDVLRAMAAAGCRVIMWGVESFSDKVLTHIRKGTTERDIWHTLRLAKKVGIANWLFLMVGNYQETQRDLAYTEQRLSKAVQQGLVQYRQVTVCTPVHGTELYENAKHEGWLVESPEGGPQMNQVYAGTPWISKRELRYWKMRLEVAK